MASLSITAFVGVASVAVLALILIVGGPAEAYKQGVPVDPSNYTVIQPSIFEGLDILAFVFVNHHSTSLIFRTMKYPSIKNWRRAITYACRAGILLSWIIGIAGYLLFGTYTKGNILNNYGQKG
jgi:sodium-coupled neutral amino acid transporter 11